MRAFSLQKKKSDTFLNHEPKVYNKIYIYICKPLQCTEFKSAPLCKDP